MDRPHPERENQKDQRAVGGGLLKMKSTGYNWSNITRIANNRSGWRDLVAALCLEMHEEDE